MMTQAGKMVGLGLSGLLLGGGAFAITPDSGAKANPYQSIVDRNVFGLKEPPPPPEPTPPPKPPVNITLTGVTSLGGTKRAFMSLLASPKPGTPAVPQSFMLAEGQRDGDIEVVSIDEKEGVVQIKQSSSPVTLSFKDNGVKGGPAVAAGAPANPMPAYQPGGWTHPSSPGQKTIPGRPLRIPGSNAGANFGGGNQQNPSLGGNVGSGYNPGQPQMPQMSADESEIIIAAQHQNAVSKNDGTASLYPPTAADPNRNVINEEAGLNPNVQNPSTQTANPRFPQGRNRRPF